MVLASRCHWKNKAPLLNTWGVGAWGWGWGWGGAPGVELLLAPGVELLLAPGVELLLF